MLPRSLLQFLAGICLCSAQQYQPQYYQQQYQPQFTQPQQSFWPQPQFDQPQQAQVQQFQQFSPPPQQQQFFAPQQFQPQQQFFQQPLQYQPQAAIQQPAQFNPVYQPQFQPQPTQQTFAPQPIQQPQFQPQPQPVYQPVNQSPRVISQPFQQAPPPQAPQVAQFFQQPSPPQQPQPVIYEQTVKVPFKRPQPPPPVVQISSSVQQPQIIQIAAPPPPQKFVPYIADIFNGGTDNKPPVITVISPDASLPPGTYIAEEIVVDGNHPSFIENIEKFQPAIVNVPPRQPQPKPFVPAPQTKLHAPELPAFPQQRPRPPPPVQAPVQSRPQPAPQVRLPPPQPRPVAPPPATAPAVTATGAKTANDVFLSCCKGRNVHKSCERICNFDILNKKTLTGMFLGTDPCPQSHGLDLLQCGASNDDHTQCCIENGVDTTSAGKKCLGFCNMKPGVSFQADVSMLPCWGVLNDIKTCFKGHIVDNLL